MAPRILQLQDVVSISNDILAMTHCVADSSDLPSATPRGTQPHTLELPCVQTTTKELHRQLCERQLQESLITALTELFRNAVNSWRTSVSEHLSISSPKHQLNTSNWQAVEQALCTMFVNGVQSLQQDVLQIVDQRTQQYLSDVEAAASASSTSDSEGGDDANRGHGVEATAILEAAYSHTNNITQAEKRRLAEITGLEPRQVVIWFQNRRNRKSRAGESRSSPPPAPRQATSAAKRKRSLDAASEDEIDPAPSPPRRPSPQATLPIKRTRLMIGEAPPPIDRRLFSSGSQSSLASSADSSNAAWIHGQQARDRNSSSGSSVTNLTSPSTSYDSSRSVSGSFKPALQSLQAQQSATRTTWTAQEPQLTSSDGYIFTDGSNIPRLDFDDLQLDPASLEQNLRLDFSFMQSSSPRGGAGGVDVGSMPATAWRRLDATDKTPREIRKMPTPRPRPAALAPSSSSNNRSNVSLAPFHMTNVAQTLNDADFDFYAAMQMMPNLGHMGENAIIEFPLTDEQAREGRQRLRETEQAYLVLSPSIDGRASTSAPNSSGPKSANSQGSGSGRSAASPTRGARLPAEFDFTFDLSSLGLDQAFRETRQSYEQAEAELFSGTETVDEDEESSDREEDEDQEGIPRPSPSSGSNDSPSRGAAAGLLDLSTRVSPRPAISSGPMGQYSPARSPAVDVHQPRRFYQPGAMMQPVELLPVAPGP